ncbi:MAG TPA: tetraacyldisaccharide 4'-kinase [Ramlibacter sp.]|jgi:tetraacyldisaccharide 4'-kinase|uniref:tetraacyldisaccharide 4'-kinase n=1 Tax=Ramlibacter sp. TaxID=1917967 RepID=UPI002D4AFAF4|nr:tetraacyldisaccharide 4'-kinase [Ramlibacter sp.]HZY19243.1 tetraacyldisaccharide 4'-kinase [Ramlibacter sp.]
MREALQRAWLGRGPLAMLLWPLSLLYGAITTLQRALFRFGWRRVERAPVPVVVVGNLVAGGGGKTPVVMALADHLRQRGIACGVISRGYGRRSDDCLQVTPASDPAEVGDEPLLIASQCQVPVVVARRRVEAARELHAAHPGIRVILSDDGLQHHALAREIEVLVFDDRGLGNGWLLPAGPLREPWPRQADLVLRTDGAEGMAGHRVGRRLAFEAVRADGTRCSLAELARSPCVALAGIARPEAFFGMLRQAGIQPLRTVGLADHAALDATDVPPIPNGGHLLCTQKDAVKLWRSHPQAWAVPLALEIDPAFWRAFDVLLDAKLSSPHGSQAA